jgi:DedD protein
MNHLRDTDVFDDHATSDREISLGTPTILGIFFVLALMCACFFGAGYTMGRKSFQTAVPTETPVTAFASAPKPTAGSPAGSSAPAVKAPANIPSSAVVVPTGPTLQPAPAAAAAPPAEKPPAPAPQPATSNQQPATAFMVQVAAVSSQDVADIELAALKKDGYAVVVRREPQDQLLHIQIGPFATRKDADAMRQRVIGDGFNAIVK